MNQTEQKLANKTKMLAYWQNEINSKGEDKAAIQSAIDRLNKEILVISGGIAPQNPVIASEAKQSTHHWEDCHVAPLLAITELKQPSAVIASEAKQSLINGEVNPNESHKADIEIWQKLKERFDLILEPPSKETYLMDNCQTFNSDFIPKFFQESDERMKVSNVKYERTAILKKADWILENW